MLLKYRDVFRAIIAPVLKPVVESLPFGELIADLVYKLAIGLSVISRMMLPPVWTK